MLTLFDEAPENPKNILPKEGEVYYLGKIMTSEEQVGFFHLLRDLIQWEKETYHLYGKTVETKRLVAWYGDEAFPYHYSQQKKVALPWIEELTLLKKLVEAKTNEKFNSCLLNFYHSGAEGMTWHSDAEKELSPNGTIASLSLGVGRKFSFKHRKDKEKVDVHLEGGSVLLMQGDTQKHWLHALPVDKKVREARINLTFRTIRTLPSE